MDAEAAHELGLQMHGLTVEVTALRTSFDIYGPMLTSQVAGLADLTNRQTKTESGVDAIRQDLAEHCTQQKVDEREERESRRWLIGQIVVACGAVTAIIQVLIGMIGHK